MSSKKRRGRLQLRKRLMPTVLQKAAEGLRIGGEAGRAIPGVAALKREQEAIITEGAPAIPAAKGRTEISTYTTRPGGEFKIYEATSWMRIRITLLTAGPVDVGTREDIAPVLSGKGGSLVTGETMEFEVKPSERIFITASAINRVRIIASPIPFGSQILEALGFIRSIMKRGR